MASALASAAAGASNPFGLPGVGAAANSRTSGLGGYQGYELLNPPVSSQQKTPTQTGVIPIPETSATTPGSLGAATPTAGQFTFDLKTDPALQQVNALVGLSDQQAQAQALKEREQLLLQYGDPKLAAAVLGGQDPMVQAAAQNQESDLAQLSRQDAQNVKGFETQLDPSLTFSGYKVGQEQQIGQNYQDALAKAAAGVQSGLDQITQNLNGALQQNGMQQANGLEQAYQDELARIEAGLGGGGGGGQSLAQRAETVAESLGKRGGGPGRNLFGTEDPGIAAWLSRFASSH
jgi:hypothetical protein